MSNSTNSERAIKSIYDVQADFAPSIGGEAGIVYTSDSPREALEIVMALRELNITPMVSRTHLYICGKGKPEDIFVAELERTLCE